MSGHAYAAIWRQNTAKRWTAHSLVSDAGTLLFYLGILSFHFLCARMWLTLLKDGCISEIQVGISRLFPKKGGQWPPFFGNLLLCVTPICCKSSRLGCRQAKQPTCFLLCMQSMNLFLYGLARTPCQKNVLLAHFLCGNVSLDLPDPLQIGTAHRITPAQSQIPCFPRSSDKTVRFPLTTQ